MPRRRKTIKEGEESLQEPPPPPSGGLGRHPSTSESSPPHGMGQSVPAATQPWASGRGAGQGRGRGRGRGDTQQIPGHGQTPLGPGSAGAVLSPYFPFRMQVPDLPQAAPQPFSPSAYNIPTGEPHAGYGGMSSVQTDRSPHFVPVQVPPGSYPGLQRVGRSSGVPQSMCVPFSSPAVGDPPGSISEQFERMRFQGPLPSAQESGPSVTPVSSSKSLRFPSRPGKGQTGTRCIVKANHFFAKLPDKDLHQYDVSISPEVTSRGVNRAVMDQLVRLYRDTVLGRRLPAYDGRKSLYTAGPLPFLTKE
eukprot:c27616_g2_i1 orf=233-1150(+)